MEKLDKKAKKNILQDWQNAFPELSPYHKNYFMKRIDAFVIGIYMEVDRFNTDYIIYGFLSPLTSKTGDNFIIPTTMVNEWIKTKNGSQYFIPIKFHHQYFEGAIVSIKKEFPLPFSGDISVDMLFNALENHLSNGLIHYLLDFYTNFSRLAAIYQNTDKALSSLNEFYIKVQSWEVKITKERDGWKDAEHWYEGNKELILNPTLIHKIVEENVIKFGLDKINYQKLI